MQQRRVAMRSCYAGLFMLSYVYVALLLSSLLLLCRKSSSRRFNEMYGAYVVAPGDIFREIFSVSEECFESF